MKYKNLFSTSIALIILLLLLAASYKMGCIAYPYLVSPYPTDINFLQAKQAVVDKWYWLLAFYLHITSATLVLVTGISQFSSRLLFTYPQWHRRMGKVYLFLLLFIAAPSGLVMAFYGNAGPWAQLGFVCQALLWWWLSYKAYRLILQRKVQAHAAFMLRSYALTLSAVSLRGLTYLVAIWKIKSGIHCPSESYALFCYPQFYIFLAWFSWLLNLALAELLLFCGILKYYRK